MRSKTIDDRSTLHSSHLRRQELDALLAPPRSLGRAHRPASREYAYGALEILHLVVKLLARELLLPQILPDLLVRLRPLRELPLELVRCSGTCAYLAEGAGVVVGGGW